MPANSIRSPALSPSPGSRKPRNVNQVSQAVQHVAWTKPQKKASLHLLLIHVSCFGSVSLWSHSSMIWETGGAILPGAHGFGLLKAGPDALTCVRLDLQEPSCVKQSVPWNAEPSLHPPNCGNTRCSLLAIAPPCQQWRHCTSYTSMIKGV